MMTPAAHHTSDVADSEGHFVELDAQRRVARSHEASRRLNTVSIPRLRLFGYTLVIFLAWLHNRFVLGHATDMHLSYLAMVIGAHVSMSWLALRRFYQPGRRFDLALFFLSFDVLLYTVVIYFTGGEKSWLFVLLLIPVAHQTNTSFRRVLGMAHLALACHLALIVFMITIEDRSIVWGAAATKVLTLYACNLYVSLTARAAEALRRRLTAAMQLARNTIGELHVQTAALKEARRVAEQASQAKGMFIAHMSHELRTPMNAVIGMSTLLKDTELSADQKEYVDTIRVSADALLTIINDILDFSKIESGKLELEVQPFDVAQCIEDCQDLVSARAAEKHIELVTLIDGDVPVTAIGDSSRVRQILANLLNNAVKFTPAGEVAVTVSKERTFESGHVELRFSVKDTGIGIADDRKHRLFQSFSQVDASTTRQFGGTGLGLAISKRLAELMGGCIGCASEAGKGAEFYFTIVVGAGAAVEEEQPLAGKVALVVDDNANQRRSLAAMLEDLGATARTAASVEEAKAIDADLRFVDGHLAGVDTLPEQGTVRLTALGGKNKRHPSLTKPAKRMALKQAALRSLGLMAPPQEVTPAKTTTVAPLRVLIADDNAVNRLVATKMLAKLGYAADAVANGHEAVDAALRGCYDIVLMDVRMPVMDGLEASRQIAARAPKGARPKIVALTAGAMEDERKQCFDAQMDDFLPKPLRIEELAAVLQRQSAARSFDREVVTELHHLAKLDRGFVVEDVLALYLGEATATLDALRAALVAGDFEETREKAHAMKGSSGNVGAVRVSEHAETVERCAEAGQAMEAYDALILLEAAFESARYELTRSMYLPLSVSMRTVSPSLMNSGT